jgi:hypothetical protein
VGVHENRFAHGGATGGDDPRTAGISARTAAGACLARDWKRRDGSLSNPDAKAMGMQRVSSSTSSASRPAATDDPIVRGAAWLKTHQRQSGRWFTFSINTDEQRDDNRYTDHHFQYRDSIRIDGASRRSAGHG